MATSRILLSHNTDGLLITDSNTGDPLPRVLHWQLLPDLLFWNPFGYFRSHPEITEVLIENYDHRLRPVYVSQPQSTPLAVVLRRSECTHDFCVTYRAVQRNFFIQLNIDLPEADEFTSLLHGR